MKKNIELFLNWCLDRLPMILLKIAVVGMIAVACVQVGIWHGRELAAGEMAWEIKANGLAMQELQERIERAEREMKTYETLIRVIECESNGRHDVYGDGGKSYGILQYRRSSFTFLAKKMGLEDADWMNAGHQVKVAIWAFQNGYTDWWSCYAKVKQR